MRLVLQRVSRASVSISGRRVGAIDAGFLLLAGFTHSDTADQAVWMAEKIAGPERGVHYSRPAVRIVDRARGRGGKI